LLPLQGNAFKSSLLVFFQSTSMYWQHDFIGICQNVDSIIKSYSILQVPANCSDFSWFSTLNHHGCLSESKCYFILRCNT